MLTGHVYRNVIGMKCGFVYRYGNANTLFFKLENLVPVGVRKKIIYHITSLLFSG